jgi:hypothetical protein
MKDLVPYLIVLFLAYATGIFYVLSMVEKPLWSYLSSSKKVFPDTQLMRQIHAQLKRLITLLPPTMVTSMGCSSILIIYQYINLSTLPSLILLIVFFCCLTYLIIYLKRRIDGVAKIASDADYNVLNRGVIQLAQLHHLGLFTAFISLLLQLWVVLAA